MKKGAEEFLAVGAALGLVAFLLLAFIAFLTAGLQDDSAATKQQQPQQQEQVGVAAGVEKPPY